MVSVRSRNPVFVLYSVSMFWLAAISAAFQLSEGGSKSLPLGILAVWFTAAIVYLALRWLFRVRLPVYSAEANPAKYTKAGFWLLIILTLAYAAEVVGHIWTLGYVPVLEAFRQQDDIKISIIRQSAYFSLPPWMRYASDYSVKALGPALLAIAFYYRSKIFWAILAVGSFYCVALFVRVLPIYFLFPVIFLAIYLKAWRSVAVNTGILVLLMGLLTAVSAPSIRQNLAFLGDIFPAEEGALDLDKSLLQPELTGWRSTSASYALFDRVAIVPARVMDQWFSAYRDVSSREKGCGYRPGAKILGCDYVHIPEKLYGRYYPENVAQGMKGSLNAASFMTEYANFGAAGFVLAGILSGIFYAIVSLIYRGHPLAVPFNLSAIIAMMETNFFTAINSGSGWIVFTTVFILFFRLLRV
ncbi:hypothetical protein FHX08_004218 [Rhizobium sp. BK529]|uniref:hypothetical protein n=1 Tax=unclassified Rhizobium TaxID=2613769 RepID=UPI00104B6312|nr:MULTISPECIES: hypothetical protein [unclassified Rhizobium]MBB3593815.1 hypothetical protein [Rhizobium sp. BK529]TCS01273.1 hypothetical protein EV281_10618 [Rhizobium sp. BK418]